MSDQPDMDEVLKRMLNTPPKKEKDQEEKPDPKEKKKPAK